MEIKNKKVLVTGADGFIGSNLVESLLEKGARVRALSYYNSFNYWGWLEQVKKNDNLEIVSGDIRDPFFVKSIMKDMDVVFNLAALIAIPYSYVAPESYISTNIGGALNVVQAGLEYGTKKIIQISTSEVYGTALTVPISESHSLQPQSPYSASKIGSDAIAMSYYNAFNLPVTIARPFNTFGPRQSARAVIPSIIIQMLNGKKEIKLGAISPTRDFNYVKDTCNGLILIAESDELIGKTVNIGSGREISIENLFYTVKEIIGSDAKLVTDLQRIRPEGSEVERLLCDNTFIKKACNYTPQFDLEQGLRETIEWFKLDENLSKYKAELYNV